MIVRMWNFPVVSLCFSYSPHSNWIFLSLLFFTIIFSLMGFWTLLAHELSKRQQLTQFCAAHPKRPNHEEIFSLHKFCTLFGSLSRKFTFRWPVDEAPFCIRMNRHGSSTHFYEKLIRRCRNTQSRQKANTLGIFNFLGGFIKLKSNILHLPSVVWVCNW